MVGRNEKCQCGSGKKYKHCCLEVDGKKIVRLVQNAFTFPGKCFESYDLSVADIKKELIELYHLHKKNPHFLQRIGVRLSEAGCLNDALLYSLKALKVAPKKDFQLRYGLLGNIAAMYSKAGNHHEALNYINQMPEGSYRKNVIEANIRREIEPFVNVARLYEKAIEEEPDFFLPYEHLISKLPQEDPKREFLIDTALFNMPSSPIAALYWADKELSKGNYSILSTSDWIDKPRSFVLLDSKEETIFNFGEKLPNIMLGLELIHEISHLMCCTYQGTKAVFKHQPNVEKSVGRVQTNLEQYSEQLYKVDNEFRCNIARHLFFCKVNYSKLEQLQNTHACLCEECQSNIDLEQGFFSGYYRQLQSFELEEFENHNNETRANLVAKMFEIGKDIVNAKKSLEHHFICPFLDFLDEEFEVEKVLYYAKKIFDDEKNNKVLEDKIEALRLYWNLGVSAAKGNSWLLSEYFFQKAVDIDISEYLDSMDLFSRGLKEVMDHNTILTFVEILGFGEANIAVTLIGQRKIKEAVHLIDKIQENKEQGIPQGTILDLKKFVNWYENKSDFSTFKNDFRALLRSSSFDIFFGEKPKQIGSRNLNLADLFLNENGDSISFQIAKHQTVEHYISLEGNDLSSVHNGLEDIIPKFRVLPENAKRSLIAAETLRFQATSVFDTAPAIMSYCKALEIFLKDVVIDKYVKSLDVNFDLEGIIQQANSDSKINQFRSLVTYIRSGYLELGSAAQCFKLSKGKTGQRVMLLTGLRKFLEQRFSVFLEEDSIQLIEDLSKNYRNPAVHEKNFNLEDLELVRSIVAKILTNALALKPVSIKS